MSNLVPNSEKLMEAFIGGLPQCIEGNVTASKPQTLEEAINISQRLMDQIIKHDSVQETNDRKRKLENKGNIINNNYQNNYNDNNHNNDYHRQQNRRQETFKIYTATNGYTRNRPLCERCTLHHIGPCTVKCQTCNRDIKRIGAQKQTTGPQESILRNELAFVHFRISTLETTLEDIQLSNTPNLLPLLYCKNGGVTERFTVDEGKRTCSCGMWQLSRMPYVHATKSMYFTVLPPKPRKMFGRSRKKRIRAISEGGSSTRVSKVEDVNVVLRGPAMGENVGGYRGGASGFRGRGGAGVSRGGDGWSRGGASGSRGGASFSRGGVSVSRGGAGRSKRKFVSSAGPQKKTRQEEGGDFWIC
ncbi:hypothetical protein Tco_0109268 [Tanacetum coccineum]